MFGIRFPLTERQKICRNIRARAQTIDITKVVSAPERLSRPILYPQPPKHQQGNAMQEMRRSR